MSRWPHLADLVHRSLGSPQIATGHSAIRNRPSESAAGHSGSIPSRLSLDHKLIAHPAGWNASPEITLTVPSGACRCTTVRTRSTRSAPR